MKFVLSNDANSRLGTVAIMSKGERAVAVFPTEHALEDYGEVVKIVGVEDPLPGLTFDIMTAVKNHIKWVDRDNEPINGLIIDDVGGFIDATLKHFGIDLPVIYAMVKDNGNTFVLAPTSEVDLGIPSPEHVAEIIGKTQDDTQVVKE